MIGGKHLNPDQKRSIPPLQNNVTPLSNTAEKANLLNIYFANQSSNDEHQVEVSSHLLCNHANF